MGLLEVKEVLRSFTQVKVSQWSTLLQVKATVWGWGCRLSVCVPGCISRCVTLCWPLTLQVISAGRLSFSRNKDQTLLGLLGGVVNRPLPVSVPSCRERHRVQHNSVYMAGFCFLFVFQQCYTLSLSLSFTHTSSDDQRRSTLHSSRWPQRHTVPEGFYFGRAADWLSKVFGQMWS